MIIIASSAAVFAGSYNAKQISFTPNDSTWNVKNVSSALDNIKQTDKTEIANLQSSISNKNLTIEEKDNTIASLNSQIESLSQYDKCITGSFIADSRLTTEAGYTVEDKIAPKFYVEWVPLKDIAQNYGVIEIYNYNKDSENIYSYYSNETLMIVTKITSSSFFRIGSHSVSLHNMNTKNIGKTYYWIACE